MVTHGSRAGAGHQGVDTFGAQPTDTRAARRMDRRHVYGKRRPRGTAQGDSGVRRRRRGTWCANRDALHGDYGGNDEWDGEWSSVHTADRAVWSRRHRADRDLVRHRCVRWVDGHTRAAAGAEPAGTMGALDGRSHDT